jgi:hypothetical protein
MASVTYRLSKVARIRARCAGSAAFLVACAALLGAGCGGDDEGGDTTPAATVTETTESAPATVTETAATVETEPSATATSPEDRPGGAGDEEPARSLASLTGRDGRITPARVRVPAFISIRVELRSVDGRRYALRFGSRTLATGGEVGSISGTFAGLRPGRALVGRPVGGLGNAVRIEATAEPGP